MSEAETLYLRDDPEPLAGELAAEGFQVLRLPGRFAGLPALLAALRLWLPLPDELPASADALYACLTDAGIVGEQPRLLVILDAAEPLQPRESEALQAFLDLFAQAGRHWQPRGGDLRLCLATGEAPDPALP